MIDDAKAGRAIATIGRAALLADLVHLAVGDRMAISSAEGTPLPGDLYRATRAAPRANAPPLPEREKLGAQAERVARALKKRARKWRRSLSDANPMTAPTIWHGWAVCMPTVEICGIDHFLFTALPGGGDWEDLGALLIALAFPPCFPLAALGDTLSWLWRAGPRGAEAASESAVEQAIACAPFGIAL